MRKALEAQPGVQRAVVSTHFRPSEDAQLVAYISAQPDGAPSAEALRSGLRLTLPTHMIPAGFVFLDSFPFTASGKIDREKLRLMRPPDRARSPADSPKTETELLLGDIWSQVLARAFVGRQDDFFDLGGDSLTAAVIAAKVHVALHVELDLRAFVDHAKLAELAGVIDDMRRQGGAPCSAGLVRVSREAPLPLSHAQERIWKYSQTPEESAGYTVARSHRLVGPLDVEALRASINDIVRRHEILRTTFAEQDGVPVQIVHAPAPSAIPLLDLAHAPDAKMQAAGFLQDEARRPFDLASLPLVRFWLLLRITADEHLLVRVSHHIISDTWSWKVFFRELTVFYEARLRGGDAPVPEFEPLQYGDYAVWQRRTLDTEGAAYRDAVAWWRDLFCGEPSPLELPFKRPEPVPETDPAEGLIWWGLDRAVASPLDANRRQDGATYYVVRLAAFCALLAGETGHLDLILGTYVTNRNRLETQDMFGFFSNLVTLRIRFQPRN